MRSIIAETGRESKVGMSVNASRTSYGTYTADTGSRPGSNATRNGSCWALWTAYWDDDAVGSVRLSTFTGQPITETESPFLHTSRAILETTTTTVSDGAFAVQTYVTTITTVVYSFGQGSATSTKTFGGAITTQIITEPEYGTITEPGCALPSFVQQCQLSWERWASDQFVMPLETASGCAYAQTFSGTCSAAWSSIESEDHWWALHLHTSEPPCTQASITGSLCSALRSSYMAQGYDFYGGGAVGDAITDLSANSTTRASIYWPTHTSFAPGCTLGCGGCQISGRSVQLLLVSQSSPLVAL